MGKVPLPVLKELEHQAKQNLRTINFAATFAKTDSICNSAMGKCQDSQLSRKSKAKFKRVPILKKQPDVAMIQPVTRCPE